MAQRNKKANKVSKTSLNVQKKEPIRHVKEALSTKWKIIIGVLLAIVAMAIYSPSINYDFVYDDDAVIKNNRFVKQGLDGLDEIWSTSYFQGYDENMNARAFRPFPLTTLAFEVEMFGLNTKVHHGTNLLFYGLTGFFLFLFLSKLMRGYHPFLPIATCLLFLLHPIHLEVVANIKSRDTMLGFLGVCMAGWLLLKHLDNRKIMPLVLSLVFYFMALFSKEEVITTLAGIPLMLWFFRDFSLRRICIIILPFILAAVLFLIYRSNILGALNEEVSKSYFDKSLLAILGFTGGLMSAWFILKYLEIKKLLFFVASILIYFIGLFSHSKAILILTWLPLLVYFIINFNAKKLVESMLPIAGAVALFLIFKSNILSGLNEGVKLTYLDNSLLAAQGIGDRTASQLFVLGNYLLKTVFPHPLISDYSYSTLPIVNWGDWRVYIALLANIGLLWVGIQGFIKRKIYGFGPLWYFTSVSIFTSLVVTNVSAYNDRFLYVPALGIVFLIAWVLSQMIKKIPDGQVENSSLFFKNNFIPVAIVALLSAASIYKIESHLPFWKDRYALFRHDVELAPQNARMRKNYGGSLARLAVENQVDNPDLAKQYATQAIEQLEYALKLYDGMATGYIHIGNMHIILRQYDEAIAALQKALQHDSRNYYAKASLGNVYYRKGDYENAIQILESIPKDIRNPSDLDVLARSYDKLGNSAKAAEVRSGN